MVTGEDFFNMNEEERDNYLASPEGQKTKEQLDKLKSRKGIFGDIFSDVFSKPLEPTFIIPTDYQLKSSRNIENLLGQIIQNNYNDNRVQFKRWKLSLYFIITATIVSIITLISSIIF